MLKKLKRFIQKNVYRREISLALLLKLIALSLLWFLFFSHPVDKHHIAPTMKQQWLH